MRVVVRVGTRELVGVRVRVSVAVRLGGSAVAVGVRVRVGLAAGNGIPLFYPASLGFP